MVGGMRGRTTLLATALVLATLVLAGAALVASQRRTLTDNVDEVLARQNARIARDVDAGTLDSPIAGQGDDESFAQIVDSSGRTTAATATTPGDLGVAAPGSAAAVFRTVDLPGVRGEYRVMSKRHGDTVIRTGTPLDDVEDSTSALIRGLGVAIPSVTVVFAALVWLLVGRVLRPVEEIRRQVAEVSGSSLDRRVPEPRSHDEISRLGRTMNGMLDRLETSAARQQQFVADASHELRSPLARMRAELEVDAAHPATADREHTQRSLLEETNTLQRLVDDLLLLAGSDNATPYGRRESVDLDDIVLREAQRAQATGSLTVDTSGVSAAQVLGDPDHLARAIRNLLDNARQHGGPAITVVLAGKDGEAVLGIADDGAGIPPDLQERVFDRFARVDEARVSSGTGTGLGLAIVRGIATSHGGTVSIDPTHAPGARFELRLPLAGAVTG